MEDAKTDSVNLDKPAETSTDTRLESAKAARKELEPIAWLHDQPDRIDVCHAEAKKVWLACKPKHVEHYTIPLYSKDDAQREANEFFGAYYKKRYEEAIAQSGINPGSPPAK